MGLLSRALPVLSGLLLGSLLIFSPCASALGDGSVSVSQDQLRALFVQRLVKYVSWPEEVRPKKNEPFIVAATDARSLRPFLPDSSRFKLVQWPVEKCHVLVLDGTSDRSIAAILKNIDSKPILTISRGTAVMRYGVAVSFIRVGSRIKLLVNPKAAEKSHLSMSSRLLSLVRLYEGEADE